MFRVAPLHPLHNAILEVVARYPESTMAELHERLRTKYKVKTSLQHVYRIVDQMLEEQVLFKLKGKVALNQMWVSYLTFYAERARRAAVDAEATRKVFPLRDGEKRKFEAASLLEMETIWNHLLVQLYRELGGKKVLHKYYSHAWWLLTPHARDVTFYKELAARGIRCLWMFGNDTPLDREGAERLRSVFTAVIAPKPPFPAEGYNLNVYGDYVLECIFPEKIQKHFAFIFGKTASMEEFDQELFQDVLSMPAKCAVTVWRNPTLAEEIRRKIAPLVE